MAPSRTAIQKPTPQSPSLRLKLRRKKLSVIRKARETRLFATGLKSPRHPILVHMVPMRKCNLACTYCNEFDKTSQPVPTDEMLRRVDRLASLGATMIHFSGGEPMLHPDLPLIIRRARSHGILTGLLTNGYLLGPKPIQKLNDAGLDHLQISIDNVQPDEVSMKSLKVLDRKLGWLAQYAEFDVNINSVVGNDLDSPEDALVIARRAVSLGFTSTIGIIHGNHGQLQPLNSRHRKIYEQATELKKTLFSFATHNSFQENMVRGLPTEWHCRAGSRYLYICEDGLVHYCSQRRGTPAIPLAEYDAEDLDREYNVEKPCAPLCTVSCVHRTAWLDQLRENPRQALAEFFPPSNGGNLSPSDLPLPVRLLAGLFLPDERNGKPKPATRLALKILGVNSQKAKTAARTETVVNDSLEGAGQDD